MTYGEIADSISAFSKRRRVELRERAYLDYTLAGLFSRHIAALFSKEEVIIPSLAEVYSILYQEECKAQEEQAARVQMELYKERMRLFAINHNRKWGESN